MNLIYGKYVVTLQLNISTLSIIQLLKHSILKEDSNMTKEIKITNYSSFDNYTIKDNGKNHSTIVSKMVQLAGRICERFSSDIVYDALQRNGSDSI